MDSKLLGGVLLIIGTSIGGGMLALPISTADVGIIPSIFMLIGCWIVMTSGALLVLEANLRLPAGSNMVSMAKSTLGIPGQVVAWVVYLTLLYTLLSGYIAGGSDVFGGLLTQAGLTFPDWFNATLFTLAFGFVVYGGIRAVDYVNRGLMFGKLGVYALLVVLIGPHLSMPILSGDAARGVAGSTMVLITSFGFASIVPSLREYFEDDIAKLRKVIVFGSLIPLLCYITWDFVIMGVLQHEGQNEVLIGLSQSTHAITGLSAALSHVTNSHWITGFFEFFTSICMLTAFLGVSMGLFDFLADGLRLNKSGMQKKLIFTLTFLPPLLIVLFRPGIYLNALSLAGICCVVLLLLLPAIMVWVGRTKAKNIGVELLPGGKWALSLVIFIALGVLFLAS